VRAVHARAFYAQYPEHPKAYSEGSAEAGLERFNAMKGKPFAGLKQTGHPVGEEVSPYTGESLGITYPAAPTAELAENARLARWAWQGLSPAERAGILVDSLERIKERFFDIAWATMHTTGQSFIMSFQASGPHANDRALEAVALGYEEQTRFPEKVLWDKPMGKFNIRIEKTFKPIGWGTGLLIGCSTFPVWNTVPGLYASLVTGNPVIVKPHPGSVLPIAIVVTELQVALESAGLDPLTVQLAPDTAAEPITKPLAEHPDIRLIDYTGGPEFGNYIENLPGKITFTEKAGVNSVILDSVENLDAVLQNLAFSISLYSGQMCTAPQNIFIPAGGVREGDKTIPYEEVAARLKEQVQGLAQHPKMGAGILGAIQNENTLQRVRKTVESAGRVLLEGGPVENPEFAPARTCSPAVIETTAQDRKQFSLELFGPVALVIKTRDTVESVSLAADLARTQGAITCSAYTTDADTEAMILEKMEQACTPVSLNLTGYIWVNQHAGFSDFHGTGGNPAGNASFTTPDFINRRFVWVGHRKMA